MGDSTTACRRTAAALHGWGLLVEPSKVIEVAVAHGRSRVPAAGVRVVQRRGLHRTPLAVLPGTDPLWVTSPVQTVVDCALDLSLVEAVVVCDSALRAGDVTVEELDLAAKRLAGVRDARKVRRVLELCDPESGSVLESVLRVRMVLEGIVGFDTQRVLRDLPGQHLRVDFCFVKEGLVVEVDGARWHQDPARDQARDNALAVLGWRVLRFTWSEVLHDSERVLQDIRDAVGCGCPSFQLAVDEGRRAA
jgi:very-short-patch-repair endonuclease